MKVTEADHVDSAEPEFIAKFGEYADKAKEETAGLSWWETRNMPLGREGLIDEAENTFASNPDRFSQMEVDEFEAVIKKHVYMKQELNSTLSFQEEIQGLKRYYVENIAEDAQYQHPDKSWADLLDGYYQLAGLGSAEVEFDLIAESATQREAAMLREELSAMRGGNKDRTPSSGDALRLVNNLAAIQSRKVTNKKIDYNMFLLKNAGEQTDEWKSANEYINSPQIQRVIALYAEQQAA